MTSSGPTRRERLLEAAGTLFGRWGFDKTSVDDIASEAGVSKGAVYLEFPTKEELFRAVLYRESLRYSEDWLRRFEKDPGEWSFARMFQHSIAAVKENPLMKALMTRDQRFFGNYLRRDTEILSLKTAMGAELFDQLQKLGAVRDDIPAPVIACLLSEIGYGIMAGEEVVAKENRVPFEETIRALGLLLDRGLAPVRTGNRKAARACLMAMVKKMQAALCSPGGKSS